MFAAGFVFAAIFAVSGYAQAGAATPASGKIGLVNTYAFGDDKAGITKFRNAMNSLDAEFKSVNDELKTLGTQYTGLAEEIRKLQGTTSAVPVKPETIQAKVDQYQTLETTIKRKQEDAKAKYERRYTEIVGPVFNDIIKALNDFAKQKGYAVILDGAKLEEAQILLGFDDKYDVTKDFITFYNARPAGTASAVKPN
jgi:Skp family chaperone for outer membrane proteins